MARQPSPQFEIAPVLRELGIDVPPLRGGYVKVLCRWHDESNPSASVSRYGYRCFGCDKSGDAISLIREEEQLSYADAVERCKEITGGSDSDQQQRRGWGDLLSSE